MKDMKTPFENDPFAMVYQAFQNLYPGKECRIFWEPEIRPEDGETAYGLTDFGDDGTVTVFVTPDMTVLDAVEILSHELAHVAVGADHEHDEVWEDAFDAIFKEYNRIGDEMFDKEGEK